MKCRSRSNRYFVAVVVGVTVFAIRSAYAQEITPPPDLQEITPPPDLQEITPPPDLQEITPPPDLQEIPPPSNVVAPKQTLEKLVDATASGVNGSGTTGYNSINGTGGLIATSTATVLAPNHFETAAFFIGAIRQFSAGTSGLPERDIGLNLALRWGALENLDVGLLLPVGLSSGVDGSFGLRSTRVSGRYLVYHPANAPYAGAVTGYLGLPAVPDSLGDGQLSAGLEGSFTLRLDSASRYSIGVNFGVDRGDYARKVDPKGYNNVWRLLGSANFAYRLDDTLLLSAELYGLDAFPTRSSGSGILAGDEDMQFLVGAHYSLSKIFALALGIGIGLPPDPERPETNISVLLGGAYTFQI